MEIKKTELSQTKIKLLIDSGRKFKSAKCLTNKQIKLRLS
jgi:hypothetical protein